MSEFLKENESTGENVENVKYTALYAQNIPVMTRLPNTLESIKESFPLENICDGNQEEASQSCIFGRYGIVEMGLRRDSDL